MSREAVTAIPPRDECAVTLLGADVAGRLRGPADLLEASAGQVAAARSAYAARER